MDWFRVALQWDPKRRGKLPDSDEVVLFNMWKIVLSKKVHYKDKKSENNFVELSMLTFFFIQELHVFITSEYRNITFLLDEKSTLENLQQWMEEQIEVPSDQQIITDFSGRLLNKAESIISQVNIQSEVILKIRK